MGLKDYELKSFNKLDQLPPSPVLKEMYFLFRSQSGSKHHYHEEVKQHPISIDEPLFIHTRHI